VIVYMAGLGIEYPPPTEDVPIFDPLLFLEADFALTTSTGDQRYLRFPTAQGKETMQDMDVNGTCNMFNGLTLNGAVGDNLTNNQNIIMNGTVGKYIQFPDGTQQTTASGGIPDLVPPPTGTYAYPSSIVVNAKGQTTSVTAGTASIPLTPTGVVAGAYTNTNLTVNQYGQITTASSGTAPVASGAYPFWSGSTVIPVYDQSILGGGVMNLQSQILFDVGALDNFDINTAVTVKFNYSISYGNATNPFAYGAQVSGYVDFYPTRANYNSQNIGGIFDYYPTDNASLGYDDGYDFGNSARRCWCYGLTEYNTNPEWIGQAITIQINEGSTGQVIIGFFGNGTNVPYDPSQYVNQDIRTTMSVELINQGNPNPLVPIKITTPYLPSGATAVNWSADPSVLWGDGFKSGGFEFGVYVP